MFFKKKKLSRYCTTDMYNITLTGGYIYQANVAYISDVSCEIKVKSLINVKYIDPSRIKRVNHRLV